MSSRARSAPVWARDPAPVFAALGDPTRLGLMSRLSTQGPLSIVRLTDGYPVSRQAITKHLRVLASVGLVRAARHGRETRWAFDPAPLDSARASLEEISRQWDAALGRLQAFVENDAPGPANRKRPSKAR